MGPCLKTETFVVGKELVEILQEKRDEAGTGVDQRVREQRRGP